MLSSSYYMYIKACCIKYIVYSFNFCAYVILAFELLNGIIDIQTGNTVKVIN